MNIWQEIFIDGLKNYAMQIIAAMFFAISAWCISRYKHNIISGLKLLLWIILSAIIGVGLFFALKNSGALGIRIFWVSLSVIDVILIISIIRSELEYRKSMRELHQSFEGFREIDKDLERLTREIQETENLLERAKRKFNIQ